MRPDVKGGDDVGHALHLQRLGQLSVDKLVAEGVALAGVVALRGHGQAHRLELPQPGRAVDRRRVQEELQQPAQHLPDIAVHGHVHHAHAVELAPVDVDVDQAGLGGEPLRARADDAVVEAGAEGDDDVGQVGGDIGYHRPVHAEHTQVEPVVRRQDTEAMDGGGHRGA